MLTALMVLQAATLALSAAAFWLLARDWFPARRRARKFAACDEGIAIAEAWRRQVELRSTPTGTPETPAQKAQRNSDQKQIAIAHAREVCRELAVDATDADLSRLVEVRLRK